MQSYVSSKKVKARTYVYQKFHNRKVLWKDASYLSLQFFSEVVLKKNRERRVNNQTERSY